MKCDNCFGSISLLGEIKSSLLGSISLLGEMKCVTFEMLVTFHAIWYVFTELCTPAWQKDLRDITFHIIEAMKEAKKE